MPWKQNTAYYVKAVKKKPAVWNVSDSSEEEEDKASSAESEKITRDKNTAAWFQNHKHLLPKASWKAFVW